MKAVRFVDESDVTEPIFQTVRESGSPVNLLVGSKKFVEGWDCWRVSTLGLMHVGKSEGAQIIQLFGRGVRLKGWGWSLKRSGRVASAPIRPAHIHELELLNVFGIEADFMQRFRDYLKSEGTVSIQPVTLNDSEFRFVCDLDDYVRAHKDEFDAKGRELYLLRNLNRGRGVGFAEASNFHPDFILWLVEGKRQHVAFIEPHGLLHEAMDSDKVRFAERVKTIERRLGDPDLVLDSFILSPTPYAELLWRPKPPETDLEERHVLFMENTGPIYLTKLLRGMGMGGEV